MRPIVIACAFTLSFATAVCAAPPAELAEFFQPPEKYRDDFGAFRSPLLFADGSKVTHAADWPQRRAEIRDRS